jgi:cytochrome c peroxidase
MRLPTADDLPLLYNLAMRKAYLTSLSLFLGGSTFVAALLVSGCGGAGNGSAHLNKAALGRALFVSTDLSSPSGQSCGSCHRGDHSFADPRQDSPTSEGVTPGIFGNRQTPSLKYLMFSPSFYFDEEAQDYIGGQFWDGRAADLNDQVHFPLLNPAEMNNPSKAAIVARVQASPLAASLIQDYGAHVFDDPDVAFDAIADAIATFERSFEFAPFTSKYDYYLRGQVALTPAEARGLALFNGKSHCNNCHPSGPGPNPLFTDFTYDNIGLPKNPNNRFYNDPPNINPAGQAFIDRGLQQTTLRPEDAGRFRVPTLRNIAVTAPYFHNGVISTLEGVVQFYNKRDLGGFDPPEISDTMNTEELGNLHLTNQEVADLVAFLETLTDGYNK